MNAVITGAASALGREVAAALESEAELRRLDDCGPVEGPGEWVEGSLVDSEAMWRAVRDIDVLIHTGEPTPNLPDDSLAREEALLDLATRGTHVLFQAAVDAGVKRFVYASTLEVFSAYPDTVYITEMYKPLPTPEPASMARYLGEITAREFARDFPVTVTALRLGKLVRAEEVAGQERDLMWVDIRDAAQAFCGAIGRDQSQAIDWGPRWAVYHICAPIPNPKFLLGRAESIGYRPQRDFQGGIR